MDKQPGWLDVMIPQNFLIGFFALVGDCKFTHVAYLLCLAFLYIFSTAYKFDHSIGFTSLPTFFSSSGHTNAFRLHSLMKTDLVIQFVAQLKGFSLSAGAFHVYLFCPPLSSRFENTPRLQSASHIQFSPNRIFITRTNFLALE